MSWRSVVALAVVLTGSAAAAQSGGVASYEPTQAAPAAAPGGMVDETPSLWFVELSGAPTSEGGSEAAIEAEHRRFRGEAVAKRIAYRERHAFGALFNGFSVRATPAELGKLRRMAGVVAVHPVVAIPIPQTAATPSPELFTALAQTGADVVQSELGLAGRGVKVGIIDTGLDYDHADLGGLGVPASNSGAFPTARVVSGWDFVGDAFNADSTSPTFNLTPTPDPLPDDCNGHGTHVAGIVGANGVVTGVAPQVTFGAYRVFGCEGSTTADIMIAAMERALADGMQVVNMSIGSAFTWPQYPTALAADRLVKRGVVVVASIGNSGASGLYSASSPGLGKDVIGVASFDNTHDFGPFFTVSPDGRVMGYVGATGAPPAPVSGTHPLARTGTPTVLDDACNTRPIPAGGLAGQIALVRRGTCSFREKALNAQGAGAVAVVLYNNVAGRVNPTVAGTPAVAIPVVSISRADGLAVNARIAAGATELTWGNGRVSTPAETGNLLSAFTSYGLSPDLDLKPDIGAPGGSIFSTLPLEAGGYASLSGTSMASPHVAGAVALLLEAYPGAKAKEVRGVLQNFADPKLWSLGPSLGFPDLTSRQGAGMLQIDATLTSRVRVEPAKLALGESEGGPATRELEVENHGPAAVTFDLSYENALSVVGTYVQTFWSSDATVSFSQPAVTVPPGGEAEVDVTITAPTGPDKGQYGGWILFTPRDGGAVLRVPFAGFVGDYQSIQVLAPTRFGFPWLAELTPTGFRKVLGPPKAFGMVGNDIPFFLVHLDHQSRLMTIAILDATGAPVGLASTDEYLPRNSGETGFFALPWDGVVTVGNLAVTLPNGDYTAKIAVLKALGHPFNPAHWESWTSPVIRIQR